MTEAISNANAVWMFGSTAIILALIGAYYLIATTNLVRTLIAVELLMKAATLAIIIGGYITNRISLAQSLVVTLIVVEVVVMVVANGVILCIYRNDARIDASTVSNLKG